MRRDDQNIAMVLVILCRVPSFSLFLELQVDHLLLVDVVLLVVEPLLDLVHGGRGAGLASGGWTA